MRRELGIHIAPRGIYNLGMGNDSVLGQDVLAAYVVRVDYPRRRFWLRRGPDARRTFLGIEYESLEDLAARVGERGAAEAP